MKIIIRTLIILAVIIAVSAATYLIFNNSSTSGSPDQGQQFSGGDRPQLGADGSAIGREGFPAGGHGARRGGHEGDAGASGLLFNLAKVTGISVIIALISLIANFIGKKKRTQTASV